MYGDEKALKKLKSLQAAAATWPHVTVAELHPIPGPISAVQIAEPLMLVSDERHAEPSYRLKSHSF